MNKRLLLTIALSVLFHALLFLIAFPEKPDKPLKDEGLTEIIMLPSGKGKGGDTPPSAPAVPQVKGDAQQKPSPKGGKSDIPASPMGTLPVPGKGVPAGQSGQKIVPQQKQPVTPPNLPKTANGADANSQAVLPNPPSVPVAPSQPKPLPQPQPQQGGKQPQRELTREEIEKILNPKEVIQEHARKKQKKPGEDEVSFETMELKYASYFHKFRKNLYNVWEYPATSVARRETGTTHVLFSIMKDGRITDVRVVESSGYPALDRAVVNALKSMGTVPLPEGYQSDLLHVDGHFSYIINSSTLEIY